MLISYYSVVLYRCHEFLLMCVCRLSLFMTVSDVKFGILAPTSSSERRMCIARRKGELWLLLRQSD